MEVSLAAPSVGVRARSAAPGVAVASTVSVGVLNITDRDYRLNPLTLYAELPRERTAVVSVKINF